MIIKNILNKISFHPTLLFVALSAIITGLFKEFIILFLIIIVHEIGHIISALYYKFNINKINLYPFGGYIVFDEKINRALKEICNSHKWPCFTNYLFFNNIFYS